MKSWSDLFLRLEALLFPSKSESDLTEELRTHIEMETAKGIGAGLLPEEAAQAARVRFGGMTQAAERCRDERGINLAEDLVRDLSYACRQALKDKSFFVVAALTLALGIGATTAIFSAVNGVLLRPLPYSQPERLVKVWSSIPAKGIPQMGFALPDLEAVADRNHSFQSIAGFFYGDVAMAGETPQRVEAVSASAKLFPLLGAQAALGRTFSDSEQSFGKQYVVVLSDGLWRSRFGARASAVGETIRLDGRAYNVIGVMPASFQFPNSEVQLWLPMSFAPKDIRQRGITTTSALSVV